MTTEPVTAETPQGADVPAEVPRRLEEVRRRFDEWRKTRPRIGPIPEELWTEAASCATEYGAHRTAVVLGLDSGKLKRRMDPARKGRKKTRHRPTTFVEVPPATPPSPPTTSECVLEVESRTGTRLRIQLRGATLADLAELARRLTREGS